MSSINMSVEQMVAFSDEPATIGKFMDSLQPPHPYHIEAMKHILRHLGNNVGAVSHAADENSNHHAGHSVIAVRDYGRAFNDLIKRDWTRVGSELSELTHRKHPHTSVTFPNSWNELHVITDPGYK